MRLLLVFSFLLFLNLSFLFVFHFCLKFEQSLVDRCCTLFACSLVDLRFAIGCLIFFLLDRVFPLFLHLLLEGILVLQKLLLRPDFVIVIFGNVWIESAVLRLWVNFLIALFFDTRYSSLLPLFKSSIIILLVFKFPLKPIKFCQSFQLTTRSNSSMSWGETKAWDASSSPVTFSSTSCKKV